MPFSHPTADGLEAWEEEAIRREVQVARKAGGPFLRHEFEDLVQECTLRWFERRARFDPSRGASRQTFLKACIRNHLTDLRRREQQEREVRAESLSAPVGDDGPDVAELWETLAVVGDGADVEASVVATLRAEAVAQAMRKLSRAERDLVVGLGSADNLSELSRSTGRSRQSLYRVIERVRTVFRAEGLDDFLR